MTNKPRLRRLAGAALMTIAILQNAGCETSIGSGGGGNPPSPSEAIVMLRAALDAWKAGRIAELSTRTPPLRFVDQDHARGLELVEYTIHEGKEQRVGAVLDVPVDIRTKNRSGKVNEVKTVYQVTLQPTAAVLRNDPD